MLSTIVNSHQEFRTCFDSEGQLGFWDHMNPNYTIFHKDTEKFTNIWTIYDKSFTEFYTSYIEDVKIFDNNKDFIAKPNEPLNTFPISAIPWVSFTGFNLNIYTEGTYLLPIFTTGKYFFQDDKILLPLSVQVHHAVCDGFHTSRLINEMQQMAMNLSEWL